MSSVDEQIQSVADTISSNIAVLSHDRALLAQNILSQLRNLVEGVAVRLHVGRGTLPPGRQIAAARMSSVSSSTLADPVANAGAPSHKLAASPERDIA